MTEYRKVKYSAIFSHNIIIINISYKNKGYTWKGKDNMKHTKRRPPYICVVSLVNSELWISSLFNSMDSKRQEKSIMAALFAANTILYYQDIEYTINLEVTPKHVILGALLHNAIYDENGLKEEVLKTISHYESNQHLLHSLQADYEKIDNTHHPLMQLLALNQRFVDYLEGIDLSKESFDNTLNKYQNYITQWQALYDKDITELFFSAMSEYLGETVSCLTVLGKM